MFVLRAVNTKSGQTSAGKTENIKKERKIKERYIESKERKKEKRSKDGEKQGRIRGQAVVTGVRAEAEMRVGRGSMLVVGGCYVCDRAGAVMLKIIIADNSA